MNKKLFLLFFVLFFLGTVSAQEYISRGLAGPIISQETFSREGIGNTQSSLVFQKFISSPAVLVLLGFSAYWLLNLQKNKKNNYYYVFGIALLYMLYLSYNMISINTTTPRTVNTEWQKDYEELLILNPSLQQYTQETYYFDYSNPSIQGVIKAIELTASDQVDAVQKSLDYVYKKLSYDVGESDAECFESRASDTIKKIRGQCDTQTTLLIALTRGLGIPTRSVGGCVYRNKKKELSAFTKKALGITIPAPQYKELGIVDPLAGTYSRNQKITSRTGGLHLWSEYYDNKKNDWIKLEATSGTIVVSDEWVYDIELYPKDDKADRYNFCVSTDYAYALECSKK